MVIYFIKIFLNLIKTQLTIKNHRTKLKKEDTILQFSTLCHTYYQPDNELELFNWLIYGLKIM